MQAGLVLRTLKILPTQVQHLPVVPPQRSYNADIENPGANHGTPLRTVPDILRRETHDPRDVIRIDRVRVVDWDQDGTAGQGHEDEHIPAHVDKAHINCCVQPSEPDEVLLTGPPQRHDPCKGALPQWWRRAGFVGMFQLRGIDDCVVWAEERE